jgi:hypothetical protein
MSGREEFYKLWSKIGHDLNEANIQWGRELMAQGVTMGRPDDGWVNREENYFSNFYPTFMRGLHALCPGDIVALGTPENYRLVLITRLEARPWSIYPYYHFAEVAEGRVIADGGSCGRPPIDKEES